MTADGEDFNLQSSELAKNLHSQDWIGLGFFLNLGNELIWE
jgi:hypothetical protein